MALELSDQLVNKIDIKLAFKLATRQKAKDKYRGNLLLVYVNRGCEKKERVTGFIVFAPSGNKVVQVSLVSLGVTNNYIELLSVLNVLNAVASEGWKLRGFYGNQGG